MYIMSSLVLFLNTFYMDYLGFVTFFSFFGRRNIFFDIIHHMTPPTLASAPVNFPHDPPPPHELVKVFLLFTCSKNN